MTKRVFMNNQKIVISEPGYDASSAALADDQKVFDSDWGYSSCLLFTGTYDLSGMSTDQGSQTDLITINFPTALSYVPSAVVWSTVSAACPSLDIFRPLRELISVGGVYCYTEIFNNRIETRNLCIPRVDFANRAYWRLFYMVFAV